MGGHTPKELYKSSINQEIQYTLHIPDHIWNITFMHYILRKTFINKSLSEQEIRGQFVPKFTQRSFINIPDKHLIFHAFHSLKVQSPLWSSPDTHWAGGDLRRICTKGPESLSTTTLNHESWLSILSAFSHFKHVKNTLRASLYMSSHYNHSWYEIATYPP